MEPETYLKEDFNPSKLTVPQLRSILVEHDVSYPSNALKPTLLQLFIEQVIPRRDQILQEYQKELDIGEVSEKYPPATPLKRHSSDEDSDYNIEQDEKQRSTKKRKRAAKKKLKDDKKVTAESDTHLPPKSYLKMEKFEIDDENNDIFNLTIEQVQTPIKANKEISIESPLNTQLPLKPIRNETMHSTEKMSAHEDLLSSDEEVEQVFINLDDKEEVESVDYEVDEVEKFEYVHAGDSSKVNLINKVNGSIINKFDVVVDDDDSDREIEFLDKDVSEEFILAEETEDEELRSNMEKETASEQEAKKETKKITKPTSRSKSSSLFSKLVKVSTVCFFLATLGISFSGVKKFKELKDQQGYCSISSKSPLNDPSLYEVSQPFQLAVTLPNEVKGIDIQPFNAYLNKIELKIWELSKPYFNCEPCPPNAKCIANELKCDPGFVKSHSLSHYLSLGNLPHTLTTTCKIDEITPLKLKFLGEYNKRILYQYLNENNAISLTALHDLLKLSSAPYMDNEQFEEYWSNYLIDDLNINPADATTEYLKITMTSLKTEETFEHITPSHFASHQLPSKSDEKKRKRKRVFEKNPASKN